MKYLIKSLISNEISIKSDNIARADIYNFDSISRHDQFTLFSTVCIFRASVARKSETEKRQAILKCKSNQFRIERVQNNRFKMAFYSISSLGFVGFFFRFFSPAPLLSSARSLTLSRSRSIEIELVTCHLQQHK